VNLTTTRLVTHTRTWVLIAGLTALFVGLGGAIGGSTGIIAFAAIGVVFNFLGYWYSDRLALRASRARPVAEHEDPRLHEIVRELARRAEVPVPRLYVIPSDQPNAFATGRNPSHAAVAVTEGLRRHMPERELAGVLAHEFAHIRNRDILVQSIAAMIGAAIAGVAHMLQFSFLFGDDDESPIGLVGALVAMIVAPMAAMLMQLAVSRQREYLADATGAALMGEAAPLADALETLERGREAIPMPVNPATASMYIVNPLHGGGMASLFMTHPPMAERIRRLRALRLAPAAAPALR
jgi:heat shock protein HtpX